MMPQNGLDPSLDFGAIIRQFRGTTFVQYHSCRAPCISLPLASLIIFSCPQSSFRSLIRTARTVTIVVVCRCRHHLPCDLESCCMLLPSSFWGWWWLMMVDDGWCVHSRFRCPCRESFAEQRQDLHAGKLGMKTWWKHDETKLGLRNWNLPLWKHAQGLGEEQVKHPIL